MGSRLSGGQQQRISIARTLLHKPGYVIFDEATSNLDLMSEKKIISTINNLKKNRTIIIIAHRLSVIKKVDNVIYIDQGKLIAQGKHNELLKNNKSYVRLFKHN